MSYALVLRSGRLTLGADTFQFATKVATTYSGSVKASASASVAAGKPVIDCKDAELTGNSYVDRTIVGCCESIKKRWGSNLEEQSKGIAECAARGAATAACMVGGVVTAGITTALAPLCGEIGAFLGERVMGYSALQLGAGIVAGAICGVMSGGALAVVCGFAVAELVGWLSDVAGPIIEGIFDPGAAKRRELAARDAYHKAIEANQRSCEEADEKYRLAWGLGVGSLKELYKRAFPTSALQAQAKKHLGFGATYHEIATAMGTEGAAAQQIAMNQGARGCYGGHPEWECPGCEKFEYVRSSKYADPKWKGTPWEGITEPWVVEGRKDPWSDVCPFSIYRFYLVEREKALGKTPKREQVTAWEKKFAPVIAQVAAQIYPAMVRAIASVGAKITSVAATLKLNELIRSAQEATREQLAARVAKAASLAEAAADIAKHGSAKEAKAAVVKANQQYDIAVAAYQKLIYDQFTGKPTTGGSPACQQDPHCKRATASLARAKAAKINAPLFAAQTARNRLLLGSAIAAGGIGAAYFFTR